MNMARIGLLVPAMIMALTAGCGKEQVEQKRSQQDLTKYVDLLIGTDGAGNTVPGACVPFGAVKVSPDSYKPENSVDSYDYKAPKIQGFSHFHLEGPGGSGYGYSMVSLTPQVGALRLSPDESALKFTHEGEVATPGYYRVSLEDGQILAELTASRHCAMHRYAFDGVQEKRVILDMGQTRGAVILSEVHIENDGEVLAKGVYQVHPLIATLVDKSPEGETGRVTVYASLRFEPAPKSITTYNQTGLKPSAHEVSGERTGVVVEFEASEPITVTATVGVSLVSFEQARSNRISQCDGRTFEDLVLEAKSQWNAMLNRIQVEGGSEKEKRMFYTALYRALMQPADYAEKPLSFCGFFGEDRSCENKGDFSLFLDDFCIWDTYRTTHPLQMLIVPEMIGGMIQTLVFLGEQGGFMPKCTWIAKGDSRIMTANPQFCFVADAVVKGFKGFDMEKAYALMRKGSMEDENPVEGASLCGYFNRGTPEEYVKNGYVSRECDIDQSASMTLEYAYDDYCVHKVAQFLGKEEDSGMFLERSKNYKNVFNPEHGFMQQKDKNGNFVEPFDPSKSGMGFTEGSSWEWTFSVPHDFCGLAKLLGGREALEAKLDKFFSEKHFTMDNEPDFHIPWIYTAIGVPEKTQALVRDIVTDWFDDTPSGLPGNDDAGATSAWLVFAMIGLYPVTPSDGVYVVAAPFFDKVFLQLGESGKVFEIRAPMASSGYRYIKSMSLDGKALDKPIISHAQILSSSVLELTLSETPTGFGRFDPCQD
jgi:predicted alpha-1,2-mannosidase